MRDLEAIGTFVAVVKEGSFTGAARVLRIPRSTVSQRVARLEGLLKVRLLERTTRVVRPTNAGTAYYQRCAQILVDVEEASSVVRDLESEPRGLLRVATRPLVGQTFLAEFAARYVRKYPLVEVELVVLERAVNLVEEGIDVAIVVAGAELDSSLIRRKLSAGDRWCCASPGYLKHGRVPRSPGELRGHDCIVDGGGRRGSWRFERGDKLVRVDVRGRLGMSSLTMAHRAALGGAGCANIPRVLCADDVRDGRLVRLFPDWKVEQQDLLVLYPSSRHLSPRVRVFVEALISEYAAAERTHGREPST